MLTIGCPQQVCASGKSTSTPSRRSSVTTACPVSGNIASLTQVTISATLMRPSASSRSRLRGVPVGPVAARSVDVVRARDQRAQVARGPGRSRRAARAWTSTLPSAVASTGPATTGRPGASAVSLAEQRVLRAAADEVHDVARRGRTAAAARPRRRDRPARGCRGCSAPRPTATVGRRRRARRTSAAIRAGMSPGGRNRGSSHVEDRHRPADAAAAGAQQSPARSVSPQVAQRLAEQPQAHHVAAGSGRVPSTPPSLVKFGGPASSVSTGASSSTPTSAQVPQEMYADVVGRHRARRPPRRPCRANRRRPRARRRRRARRTRAAAAPTSVAGVDAAAGRAAGRGRAGSASSASHSPVRHVEQPGGGGVGALGDWPAR